METISWLAFIWDIYVNVGNAQIVEHEVRKPEVHSTMSRKYVLRNV